ncbi:MAG TPA: putative ABC exporter domain-containing protein [Gemmatimonadaceae bacterium]|nr:putative ABC exporter domain-containing protein [Gemmatimonadaceae bacterium]
MSAAALGFLLGRSFRNRVVSAMSRLRSPRYAIGAVVGIGYFVLVFGPSMNRHRVRPTLAPSNPLVTLAPLALAALVAWWWFRGGFQSVLAFTPAEVEFLFSAPLTRRALVLYKLLRTQLGLVFTAAFILIVLPVTLPLAWPLALVSIVLALTVLHWHQLGSSLVRADLAEHATSAARRSTLPTVIFIVALAALLSGLVPELPAIRASADVHEMLAHIGVALQRPGPAIVLYPFHLLLAPITAPNIAAWLRGLPAVLVLLALHGVWVIRSDAAFEEAAAEAGRKRAERLANRRKGLTVQRAESKPASRAWFDLAPTGRPGVAIVWKNVLVFMREFRPAFLALAVLAIAVVYVLVLVSTHSVRSGAIMAAGVLAGLIVISTIMSPIGLRNDLRGDLRRMELLRTYPLRGRELVASEILGATASLALMQAGLLVLAIASAILGGLGHEHPTLLVLAAVAGLPFAVTATAAQYTVQNAIALFFPAWVSDTVPAGIDGMGQRIVMMLGSIVLLVLIALPAGIVGALAFLAADLISGGTAGAVAGAVVAAVGVWGELAGAIVWLGRVYDRLDPVEAGIVT